jgi:hypothetical protein
MADIDIASPGANEAALKAALAALTGMTLLASGKVQAADAANEILLALPGLYPAYKLILPYNTTAFESEMYMQFSDDGGLTYETGAAAYENVWQTIFDGSSGTGTGRDDKGIIIAQSDSCITEVNINPGSAVARPAATTVNGVYGPTLNLGFGLMDDVFARQNYIRLTHSEAEGDVFLEVAYLLYGLGLPA